MRPLALFIMLAMLLVLQGFNRFGNTYVNYGPDQAYSYQNQDGSLYYHYLDGAHQYYP